MGDQVSDHNLFRLHYLEYQNPHDYFRSDIAEKIEASHSLLANLYWIRFRMGDTQDQVRKTKGDINALIWYEVWLWMKGCFTFTCLIFLGLFFGKCSSVTSNLSSSVYLTITFDRRNMLAETVSDLDVIDGESTENLKNT